MPRMAKAKSAARPKPAVKSPRSSPRPEPAKASPTKPRPSRTGALSRPVEVEVRIDRDLKRRWEEALAQIKASKREGAGAFDDLWETIGLIVEHEPPLYLAGGFSSAKQFYKEHVGETERTAKRLIRVAKHASPNEEVRYGVSKLDAALGYIEAASGGEARRRVPVDFARLRIPVRRDGQPARVSLEEASVEEIRAATRALRGKQRGAGEARGAGEPPAIAALRRALRDAGAPDVKVQVARDKVSLSGIPLAALSKTLRALAAAKLPQ